MRPGAAQLLERDLFPADFLDDGRPRYEYVGTLLHLDDEVAQCGGIRVASGAGAHDGRDLRHDAGIERVLAENFRDAEDVLHAFLDARAARGVQADDRHTGLARELEDVVDLRAVDPAHRSAQDGLILRVDEDPAPADGSVPRDDAVTEEFLLVHSEIVALVLRKHVQLREALRIEDVVDSFAGRQPARVPLLLQAVFPASAARLGLDGLELCEHRLPRLFAGHRVPGNLPIVAAVIIVEKASDLIAGDLRA